MAGYRRRGGRGGFNPYNQKAYQFTARRRAALKKAQAKSARKRAITMGILAVGAVGAIGTAAYMGHKHRDTITRHAKGAIRTANPYYRNRAAAIKKARLAVHPANKEAMRIGGAISPAGTPNLNSVISGLAAQPHTPGDAPTQAKPDTSKYTRTVLPPQDPAPIRQALQEEADYRASAEGSLEKFVSVFTDKEGNPTGTKTDRSISRRLLAGKPVKTSTIKKALERHSAARIASSANGLSDDEQWGIIADMVADGHATGLVNGKRVRRRANPKVNPQNSVITDKMKNAAFQDWIDSFETDNSHRTTSGTPGVPAVTTSASGDSISSAIGGIKARGAKATPQIAPTQPAVQLPLFSDVKPQPHVPGGITSSQWKDTHHRRVIAPQAMVGKKITDWDKLNPVEKEDLMHRAHGWLLGIDPKTGTFTW